jgi:FKBP-type peptidyl-prolyl cis-trans isomerase
LSTGSAEAVSTSRRALRASKLPESDFTTLPNGLKYYDIKVGNGAEAVKGSRVAVHYVAKWKGITFMTSRQGLGVGGGTPYGFDVGQSERGNVLKGLDLGVEGMRVGGQRLVIVPPELAYGKKGVQEIPPNATIELDIELLSIKQSPFGTPVKIVEG